MPVTVKRQLPPPTDFPIAEVLATCRAQPADKIRLSPFGYAGYIVVINGESVTLPREEAIEFFTACLEMAQQQVTE